MRKYAVLPFLLVLLAGCAALGVPEADTFNKRVIVANSIAESAASTVATLTATGKLSKEDAQSALDRVRTAAIGIDIARDALPADPKAADARLTAVVAALNAIVAELETRK